MSSNEFAPPYSCCGGITFHGEHCTRHATVVQPMSTLDAEPTVYSLVLADLAVRDEMGRAKYGKSLQPHNGRDALVDAYQEHLDELFYMRQEIAERADHAATIARLTADLAATKAALAEAMALLCDLSSDCGDGDWPERVAALKAKVQP